MIVICVILSLSKFYHFADVSKMISHYIPCILTSFFCFFNYIHKITPLTISQCLA